MPNDVLPPIAYADLVDRLSDPESDLDHYLGYLIEVPVPERMGPELVPNPALVTDVPPQVEGGALISLANGFMRARRHRTYRQRLRNGWSGPRIISEGDSWFQYPTRLQDIIDHLMKDHLILSLGAAGDELSDIRKQHEILHHIQREGAAALLLSAGGNDLFDNGQLGRLIEDPFPGATGADLVGPTVDAFLQDMVGQYLDLFRKVHRAFPKVHMFIHGYGPAFPRGGSWIAKPLTRRGVPKPVQHDVVKVILAKFNATLASLAARAEFHGHLTHIDVTDIGTRAGDWHDEIHLDGPNYAKVAERFRQALRTKLTAAQVESAVDEEGLDDAEPVRRQAENLAALDQATLLHELDLRVGLLELDPSVAGEADMPPLFPNQPQPEIGVGSIARATRRLIDHWTRDLREVICGGGPADTACGTAIVQALGQSKSALATAIAGWLVAGPLPVPVALAGTLAAWLAGEVLEVGRDGLCALWQPAAPSVGVGAVETTARTIGDMRQAFRTPADAEPKFDADRQKDRLDILGEALAKQVVEPPHVPVDANGAEAFTKSVAHILERLGGEEAEVAANDSDFGFAEALILTDGTRPAVYVRDGSIDLNDPLLQQSGWLDEIGAAKDDIHRLIAASGRVIDGSDRSANSVYGSAWMLTDGRVATAQHVLEAMSIRDGDGWALKSTFFVDFAVEADRPINADAVFRIEGIERHSADIIARTVNPAHLDVATFRLVPKQGFDFPDPIPLATSADGAQILDEGRFFNVGHPAAPRGSWLVDTDDGNPNTVSRAIVHALIGDRFGVKRLSPGMFASDPGTLGADTKGHVFTHDATTLGGSSGSGIMAKGTSGNVMTGLHFAGLFGTRNYAHWGPAITEPLT